MLKDNTILQLFLVVIGSVFALVLIRFPFPVNLIALIVLIALLVSFYIYNVIIKEKTEKIYANSFLGQMDNKRQNCQEKISLLKKEIKSIDANIKDIRSKLVANPKASPDAIEESRKIIEAFQEEKKLRQSKIDFYELCLSKFNQIIKNHQLAEDLKVKREKLAALKENNIEEVAEMEGMRTFIDYEKAYIETIDELSLRMLKSRSIEKAEALQLELVEMTKELRSL